MTKIMEIWNHLENEHGIQSFEFEFEFEKTKYETDDVGIEEEEIEGEEQDDKGMEAKSIEMIAAPNHQLEIQKEESASI